MAANVAGDLFELPAGKVALAAGIETRQDKGWRDPDSLVAIGVANTNAAEPISGTVKSDEIYAELSVPVLAGLPLAESFVPRHRAPLLGLRNVWRCG